MTPTWTQLAHAARAAAVGGVVGGALTLAVLWLRRPRRRDLEVIEPQAAPELPAWLYRDAPDRPVVIPAQRRGGTA